MHPAESTLTGSMQYAGHEIRRGTIQPRTEGSRSFISPVISGSSDRLTPALAAKINVLRGLDVAHYTSHTTGTHLGNFAATVSSQIDDELTPCPTVDQLLAWSDSFYDDLSSVLERTLVVGRFNDKSYGWSNPEAQSGEITALPGVRSSLQLFNRIFVPDEEETSPRPPVVDRVFEHYQSLRQGNRRLSIEDRHRLDEHVARIEELQRRLSVTVSCGDVEPPVADSEDYTSQSGYGFDPDLQGSAAGLFNDVIVAAFLCGTSRIAVVDINDRFSAFQGDWHQDIAHQAHLAEGTQQATLAEAHQRSFELVMLDLIAKMEVDEGDGTTLLDNSIVQWTQEAGVNTHHWIDATIVTAGSAGGCWATGQYLDYRNRESEERTTGLLHNQYLGTFLRAMGQDPADYRLDDTDAYPDLYVAPSRADWYSQQVLNARGESLPWLEA